MISICNATPNEAMIVAELAKESFLQSHSHSASASDIDSYISKAYALKTVTEELDSSENIFRIIYFDQQPAGYSKVILNSQHEEVNVKNVTKLERLYLLKEFYDLKLGLKLLEHNIAISKEANQSGMWLHTWTENKRAVAFYEKAGFQIIGKADFRISETHSNPNHLMYLKF